MFLLILASTVPPTNVTLLTFLRHNLERGDLPGSFPQERASTDPLDWSEEFLLLDC